MIKEVSISVGKTVNTGNYESLKVQIGLTSDVVFTDDKDKIYEELKQQAIGYLNDTISDLLKEK